MIADQNVKFDKKYFWSVVAFHPGAFLSSMGVNSNLIETLYRENVSFRDRDLKR